MTFLTKIVQFPAYERRSEVGNVKKKSVGATFPEKTRENRGVRMDFLAFPGLEGRRNDVSSSTNHSDGRQNDVSSQKSHLEE